MAHGGTHPVRKRIAIKLKPADKGRPSKGKSGRSKSKSDAPRRVVGGQEEMELNGTSTYSLIHLLYYLFTSSVNLLKFYANTLQIRSCILFKFVFIYFV